MRVGVARQAIARYDVGCDSYHSLFAGLEFCNVPNWRTVVLRRHGDPIGSGNARSIKVEPASQDVSDEDVVSHAAARVSDVNAPVRRVVRNEMGIWRHEEIEIAHSVDPGRVGGGLYVIEVAIVGVVQLGRERVLFIVAIALQREGDETGRFDGIAEHPRGGDAGALRDHTGRIKGAAELHVQQAIVSLSHGD